MINHIRIRRTAAPRPFPICPTPFRKGVANRLFYTTALIFILTCPFEKCKRGPLWKGVEQLP